MNTDSGILNANMNPTVSVCIPTYRGAEYLGRAIESVLAQTFRDFELLVIDDNSPDDTEAIVASYKDPRLRYLRNETNLGPEDNWNRCLKESRGRYFKLLPQDDILAKTCLERQVEILENDAKQQIALVFCARTIIDAADRVLTQRRYPGGREGVILGRKLIRRCLRYGTNLIGEPGSVLFRLEQSTKVGRFDASIPYVLDLDYWVRLLLKSDAYYIPEALASFRVSPISWSVAIGTRQGEEFSHFISKAARFDEIGANCFDLVAGRLMARVNNLLRIIFYHFVLNKA